MSVDVVVPSAMRGVTGNESCVSGSGATVGALFADLEKKYPGLHDKLYDSDDNIYKFVACFLNGIDIRTLENSNTPLSDGDEVVVIAAIAGG